MGWVDARDYEHAAPDPLAEAPRPGILAHMNSDHVDAMIPDGQVTCLDQIDRGNDDLG